MKYMKIAILLWASWMLAACSSVPMKEEGSKSIYTSQFDNKKGILHGVNVGKMADGAPLRIVAMVHTPKPPSEAWQASLADISRWSDGQITKVTFHSGNFDGKKVLPENVVAGNFRQCLNEKNGDLLVEKIRHIDHEKMMYVYSVDFDHTSITMPMSNHTGAVTVEPDGQGGSLLTFRAYFDRSWHPMSLIFPPLFRGQFNKFMNEFAQVYGGTAVNSKFNR